MTEAQKEYYLIEKGEFVELAVHTEGISLSRIFDISVRVMARPYKSDAVLDELEKWLYEEGMKFEKICDSEENFVNATGACARRAQCYYAIEKLTELRTKEREQR